MRSRHSRGCCGVKASSPNGNDRNIDAGEEWRKAIDENLNSADIILLLISPPFIASDDRLDNEMKAALKRHDAGEALVVPVIVRPVMWKGTLFEKLQALPKNAKPVTLWKNRDQAWTNVAEGIAKDAKAIAEEQPIDRAPSGSTIVASTPAAPPTPVITKAPLVRESGRGASSETPRRACPTEGLQRQEQPELAGELTRREGDAPTSDVAIDEAVRGARSRLQLLLEHLPARFD